MKAYKISCEDDDHGQIIVFAKSSKSVDRRHNSDRCDCEFINRHVRRSPEFDQYAPGPVTIEQLLKHGWQWECPGCFRFVDGDDNPIVIDDYVYHSRDCVIAHRKSWNDADPGKCHDSVRTLLTALDEWLAESTNGKPTPERKQ